MNDHPISTGDVAMLWINVPKREFLDSGYRLVCAGNVGVRVSEVIVQIGGETFETTFSDFERAIRSLKKTEVQP